MTKDLDTKDWRILELLCKNARLSHNQIAKQVELSKNAVTYRINRLMKKGIIDGFFTIIQHELLGINDFELLLKIRATKEQEQGLVEYLKNLPNLMVLDRLSGEWNFVMEFGFKRIEGLYKVISELKANFSGIIDSFEVYPILYPYKVEQLPIELIKQEKEIRAFERFEQTIELDNTDMKLLYELNQDSTASLLKLAQKLNITAETVATRIKKLKQKGIILRFTAKIDLQKLGYDVYLIMLDIRNLSKQREDALRSHLILHKKIRYAFMSATKPEGFIYFAAKSTDDLDNFFLQLREKFSDVIVNQKYLFLREKYKYDLFPRGFLEE